MLVEDLLEILIALPPQSEIYFDCTPINGKTVKYKSVDTVELAEVEDMEFVLLSCDVKVNTTNPN